MAKKQTKTKKCPPMQFFMVPTLEALNELGGSGSNEEIYNRVITNTQLSTAVINEMHNFTMTEVEYRMFWARTYLKNYGAIESSKQRVWALTAKGAKMLKEGNIDTKEIYKFTQKKKSKSKDASEEELIDTESINWREQITEKLHNLDPYAF